MWALTPLTEEQLSIQAVARDFAKTELAPHTAAWDREAYFEPTLIPKLGQLGFLGMMIPEEFDGMGLDTLTYLVALEEIASVDASVAVTLSVHNSLPTSMILRWGTPEQKEKYLKPMARGEKLGVFCLSEPEAGSDAASLTCQAVRDGDHWVLNGAKSWVTSGAYAGVALVMARTDTPNDRRGARGISAFIVTPDMAGFKVGKKEDKMGLRSSATVQLVFDDMRVPAANMLGEQGMGFVYAMQSLDNGRLGISAQAIGIAEAALRHSAAYAAERKQFGKPIKEFQAIQFKLADMAMRVASARALLHMSATAKARGERMTQFSAMTKLIASETAMTSTTQAYQIYAGYA